MAGLSLKETFQEDAQEIKDILMLFGGLNAQIVNCGRRKTGAELAHEGMALAADHADQASPGWRESALSAVKEFIKHNTGKFQAEDVRFWAKFVPPAPSLRAWGSVMIKAARMGLIRNTGETAKVKNPIAHMANSALWVAA